MMFCLPLAFKIHKCQPHWEKQCCLWFNAVNVREASAAASPVFCNCSPAAQGWYHFQKKLFHPSLLLLCKSNLHMQSFKPHPPPDNIIRFSNFCTRQFLFLPRNKSSWHALHTAYSTAVTSCTISTCLHILSGVESPCLINSILGQRLPGDTKRKCLHGHWKGEKHSQKDLHWTACP